MVNRMLAAVLVLTVGGNAAPEAAPTADAGRSCPKPVHAANLCAAVADQTVELEPRHPAVMYQYQSLVYDAACVEAQDPEPVVVEKIQAFWNRYGSTLTCRPFDFTPRDGNILKLAVAEQADPFIVDVLSIWRVDLNRVDPVDGMTVLDFIELRQQEAGSNANLVGTYQRFFDRFRAAGAKRAAELPASPATDARSD